jgi:type I restriction enzyme, S subunit
VPLILKIYEAKFDALSKRCDAVAPIMSFPRYPQYKDSGVEWLGEVPGHWEVTALKRGFNVTLGKMLQPESNSPDDELLPYLRAANIQWDGIESTDIKQMWLSKRDRSQLRLEHGDLLVSEGGDVGRSCIWASELEYCYFQNSVNRVRARDGHSNRYLYYWISTVKDKGYIDVLCNKSTIAHFTAEKVAAVPVPLPTTDEQTQIAAFLDRETAKIDDLVAQQRRLMELLKEKRQAVISHAVTQGLNPQAPMKHSGIEWLGDVPVHWEIKSIRYILDAIGDVDHFMPESVEKGVPYLMTGDLKEFVSAVSLDDCKQISHADYWELSKRIKSSKGDVIMARYATIGTSMYVDIDADFLVSYSCVTLKANQSKVSGFYLFHYMKSAAFRQGVENRINTNTQGNVGIKDLQSVKIAVAPIDEQTAIAVFLDAETAKFDTLTTVAQLAIDLLQERRTALISAAVTGQIDVRKA